MVTKEFPYCCTMKILAGFGQSEVAEGGSLIVHEDTIRAFIERKKEEYNHLAALVITTNTEQTIVNKVLVSMGFKKTKWMSKDQHSNTKVRIWWLPLHEAPAVKPAKKLRKLNPV